MPLILNQYRNTYRLALWSLTEPLSFFEKKSHLSPSDQMYYDSISNESRKREWLAVRVLLNEALGFWPQISYTETGKPILHNHTRHLSVSHSKSMVGILLCTSPHAGIDIERTSRSIDKVASRFLSEKELDYIQNNTIPYSRIIYWCAKEAIFKAVNASNIQFSKQIFISKISDKGQMKGHFSSEKENLDFVLNFIEVDEHLIVWTN